MDNLEIVISNKTSTGVVHANLKSSGDDLGVLYLTEKQYNTLANILRTGCFNKEVDFSIDDPYNSDEEEDDLHRFFSID